MFSHVALATPLCARHDHDAVEQVHAQKRISHRFLLLPALLSLPRKKLKVSSIWGHHRRLHHVLRQEEVWRGGVELRVDDVTLAQDASHLHLLDHDHVVEMELWGAWGVVALYGFVDLSPVAEDVALGVGAAKDDHPLPGGLQVGRVLLHEEGGAIRYEEEAVANEDKDEEAEFEGWWVPKREGRRRHVADRHGRGEGGERQRRLPARFRGLTWTDVIQIVDVAGIASDRNSNSKVAKSNKITGTHTITYVRTWSKIV